MSRIFAVIPSLSATPDSLAQMCSKLRSVGVSPIIITNGLRLTKAVTDAGLPHATSETNAGFATSVNFGAQQESWDWLLILNDDAVLDADALGRSVGHELASPSAEDAIVYLSDEAPRRIPGYFRTLGNVSLIAAASRRFRNPPSKPVDAAYRSFSAVAIRRDLWDTLGGLDERYGFTFEDVDFVRRAHALGYRSRTTIQAAARHSHSLTTTRHIADVLPVTAYSALEYLDTWYGHRTIARGLIVAALLARVPLALLKSRRAQHLSGIGRSIRSIVNDTRPSLPRWKDN